MLSYNRQNIPNMLFLDIETVREFKTFEEFKNNKKIENWKKVSAKFYADAVANAESITDESIYLNKAALYPEYAKIVCVSLGRITYDATFNPIKKFRSLVIDPTNPNDEEVLCRKVADEFNKSFDNNSLSIITGHNIFEFDVPFIIKRLVKHGIKIPIILQNIILSKPWDNKAIDTMKDWKMNTSKILSLDTLTEFLGIPSSKDGVINGANLGEAYWNRTDRQQLVKDIAEYCEKDVSVSMDVVLKLSEV